MNNNVLTLTLDNFGVEISSLFTSYNSIARTLTVTAQTAGTISASTPLTGVAINTATDTIAINLDQFPRFAGLSILGGDGNDKIQIGTDGINLAAVTKGAAALSFSIDTGKGTADTISFGSAIKAKGSGAVTLASLGSLSLAADSLISAGGAITFEATIDGHQSLSLSSGNAIRFNKAVGAQTALAGLSLLKASKVDLLNGLQLNGADTPQNSIGLLIGKGVNNLTLTTAPSLIQGFSGSGISFLGGSTKSTISLITLTGNGTGITAGSGTYTGSVLFGNTILENLQDGIRLLDARGLTIGSRIPTDPINRILFNGSYGINSSGACSSSIIEKSNQINNNLLGAIRGLRFFSLGNCPNSPAAAYVTGSLGLKVNFNDIGLGALKSFSALSYDFDTSYDINGTDLISQGSTNNSKQFTTLNATVGIDNDTDNTTFIRSGNSIFVDAKKLSNNASTQWVQLNTLESAPGGINPDAIVSTSALVRGLTPVKVLEALQFSGSIRPDINLPTDQYGKRFTTSLGLSTLASLIPAAELTALATSDVFGNDLKEVTIWINSLGFLTRMSADVESGSGRLQITINLTRFGAAVKVTTPSSDIATLASSTGQLLFADGADGTTGSPDGLNGGVIVGHGASGGKGGQGGWFGNGGHAGFGGNGGNGGLLLGAGGQSSQGSQGEAGQAGFSGAAAGDDGQTGGGGLQGGTGTTGGKGGVVFGDGGKGGRGGQGGTGGDGGAGANGLDGYSGEPDGGSGGSGFDASALSDGSRGGNAGSGGSGGNGGIGGRQRRESHQGRCRRQWRRRWQRRQRRQRSQRITHRSSGSQRRQRR
ncbi:MAG: hypothetical protein ACKOCM_00795 [Cyanobacteriota bacterium]